MKQQVQWWMMACLLLPVSAKAQLLVEKKQWTKADTLRGSITRYRMGWDVIRYDLTVKPDIETKTITGKNTITFCETGAVDTMQIDLQQPLIVDSISSGNKRLTFIREDNICWVQLMAANERSGFEPVTKSITVYYHGKPREAVRAPWDGGLVWSTDLRGNPFVGTACQGLGASAWWPCKDHQSDEPDSGMTIHITVPEPLSAVSNGRLVNKLSDHGNTTWTWQVKNPINSYGVTMNIGKYAHWSDTLMGEAGKLDLGYWVLDYNLQQAKKHFAEVKPMLRSHEYWFGKYPFYEDGYKLVETPFLGMEHQSAVAYGNQYKNGYLGHDLSGTGWGLKWDYIIVHESGHEWFGNNITTKDIADMWVHEGFTDYSETLYIQSMFGKKAGDAYCYGLRKDIENSQSLIGPYGVNEEGSGDMYNKGANLLQNIRHSMNDDAKFRDILRGLNSTFYHQTVTSTQVEEYISKQSGIDFSKVFDQYLRTIRVPRLDYYFAKDHSKMFFKWSNCVDGFNLPLVVADAPNALTLHATENWQSTPLTKKWNFETLVGAIEKRYYILLKQLPRKS